MGHSLSLFTAMTIDPKLVVCMAPVYQARKRKDEVSLRQRMRCVCDLRQSWPHTSPGSKDGREQNTVCPVFKPSSWTKAACTFWGARTLDGAAVGNEQGGGEGVETWALRGGALAPGLLLIGQVRYLTVGWASSHCSAQGLL